jgi:hypothetical protein
MSVPVAGEWLWKRVIFVNPLPLANVWFKKSKAGRDGAFAQGINLAAFFFFLQIQECLSGSILCWDHSGPWDRLKGVSLFSMWG